MPAPVPIDLGVVLAILRLSNKYDIQYLYRRALDHLAEDGWYAASYAECGWGNHLNVLHKNSPLNALSVVTTAIEVGATWLLPRAYYCASTFYPPQLLPFMEGNMQEHVRICLIAHVQLLRGTVSVNSFLTMRYLSCTTPHVCDTLRDDHYLHFLADVDTGRDLNALSRWDDDDWTGFEADGMCDACRQSAKTRHDVAASTFWAKLPNIFGLPPWEDLHTMKRIAMGEDEDEDQNIED